MCFLVFLGLAVVGACKRIAIASASAGWPVLQLDCLRESRGQPFCLAACVQFEPFRAIAKGAIVCVVLNSALFGCCNVSLSATRQVTAFRGRKLC